MKLDKAEHEAILQFGVELSWTESEKDGKKERERVKTKEEKTNTNDCWW